MTKMLRIYYLNLLPKDKNAKNLIVKTHVTQVCVENRRYTRHPDNDQ